MLPRPAGFALLVVALGAIGLSQLGALSCGSQGDAASGPGSGEQAHTAQYWEALCGSPQGECGGGSKAGAWNHLDPDGAGELTIVPGPGHVVRGEGNGFHLALRYRTVEALAEGHTLEIIPFAHRQHGTAAASLQGGGESRRIDFETDSTYSSLSVQEPAGTVRFLVPLPEMARGQAVVFTYDLPQRQIKRSHHTLEGPCSVRVVVRLRSPAGELVQELPTPQWEVATAGPKQMAVILPSQARVGAEVPMIVRVTAADAPTFRFSGEAEVEAQQHVQVLPGRRFTLGPDNAAVRELRVRFDRPGLYRLSASAGKFSASSNPIRVGEGDGEAEIDPIFWGEMHWHTRYSWDSRNYQPTCFGPAEALRFARKASLMDFMSVSDHGQHDDPRAYPMGNMRRPQADMLRREWNAYRAETLDFDEAAEDIIAYVGYEHRDPRGDTNVVFRGEAPYFHDRKGRRKYIADVWEAAEPGAILTFPQLHLPGRLRPYRTPSVHERLIEVRSWHAAFEYYLNPQPFPSYGSVKAKHGRPGDRVFAQELLAMGRRLGLIANDDHGDLPGNAGITAVYAPERGHDAILDTLLERHAYGTTGARMIVDFRLGDLFMGDERRVPSGDPLASNRELRFSVHGTAPIEKLTLWRNNEPIHELSPDALDVEGRFADTEPLEKILLEREVGNVRSAYYYLRVVQADGETAWSSPIFLLAE